MRHRQPRNNNLPRIEHVLACFVRIFRYSFRVALFPHKLLHACKAFVFL